MRGQPDFGDHADRADDRRPGASARAESIGVPAAKVDGNDVAAVDARRCAAGRATCAAGAGPRFLHAVTYRFKGHVSVDPGAYRDQAEVAAALAFDPLLVARAMHSSRRGIEGGALDAIDA